MAKGAVSAARTRISAVPRLSVLVAIRQVSAIENVMHRRPGSYCVEGVRRRCTFICAFLQLAIMGSLLHKIQDVLSEGFISDRPGYRWSASTGRLSQSRALAGRGLSRHGEVGSDVEK